MTNVSPLRFVWEGDCFRPASPRHQKQCDEHFAIGEIYLLVEHQDRSVASHNHYFASLADAWRTLPDDLLETYPSSEHLRKKALIRKGYCDERSIVCASKAEAQKLAAFIKPMDHYAILTASEATVRVFTAKSQSRKAMGAKMFKQSKDDVFAFVDELLGVNIGDTKRNAGQAA